MVGALVVVPYYVRPSEAAIVEHFRAVAEASPVPVIAYNIPSRTGRGLGAPALLEVARIPNVAGVKQAVGARRRHPRGAGRRRPDSACSAGDEAFAFPTVCMGGVGAIAAASHLCTAHFVAMIECALAGKLDDGRAHAEALLPMIQAGFSEPNPAVFKGVLHAQGRIATPDAHAARQRVGGRDRALPRRRRERLALNCRR